MEILVTLIEAYENKYYPITPPDPVDAIKFRMEQQGLKARDLEEYIEVFYNREITHSANDYVSPVDYVIQQKAV